MSLKFRKSSTIKIFEAKATKLFEVRDFHAFCHEFIKSDSKPDVDSFDDLEGSWTLDDDWLLYNVSKPLCELECVIGCEERDLKHLACFSLITCYPYILKKSYLDKLTQFLAGAIVLSLD